MDDPRIGPKLLQPAPEPGPAPVAQPLGAGRRAHIGQSVHFFPHRGHHTEWYFGPYAAIVIHQHPNDPRICHLYWFGPKGETGSYADIPHRSMRPECEPVSNWLGRSMPPSSHWAFVDESEGA